jgi:hypothetical protein
MRNGENNRDSTDLSIILMLVQWDGNRMGGYSSWASLLGEGYAHGYNCIAVGFFLTPNYDYVATCNWNPQVESKVDGNYNDSKWGSGITWGPIVYECAYTYIHTFIHSYIHTYIHTLHKHIHQITLHYTHTLFTLHTLHTYKQTGMHTYIHACMHTLHTYIHNIHT